MGAKATITFLAVVFLMAGCMTEPEQSEIGSVTDQQFTYRDVKSRIKQLEPGMNKSQVKTVLGTPAKHDKNMWRYMTISPAFVIPAETLVVEFEEGVYVGHRFESVVRGKPVK